MPSVADVGGQPLNGYRVRITSPEDASLDESVFSGSTLTFGAGGFELPLGGAPQEESNVALVSFVQVR